MGSIDGLFATSSRIPTEIMILCSAEGYRVRVPQCYWARVGIDQSSDSVWATHEVSFDSWERAVDYSLRLGV